MLIGLPRAEHRNSTIAFEDTVAFRDHIKGIDSEVAIAVDFA